MKYIDDLEWIKDNEHADTLAYNAPGDEQKTIDLLPPITDDSMSAL